ncbi:ABCB family ABC transporter ATP-binding protein/permease [Denitrobaculum tricleocarpae]|uniref:ABC transporter ATP-binding protein/permease n=1 Tax=Denitrobaculum tricleocarpae TaxID=2591009 RepID=A0A545T7X9_9PROT|nr:ABC transporter ATP-binding protein/permease [Denitrobaculum tricleocarpae]
MRSMSTKTLSSDAASGETSTREQLATLRNLLPYLWPAGRNDLRLRVLIALGLMVGAKVTTVYVPLLLRSAVDRLSPGGGASAANLVESEPLIVLPLGLLLAYGLARILGVAFAQVRDAVFSKVAQHAIRQVALQTFEHLHRLSLRFHLDRQTGGLTRAIDRGTKGIEFLLFFVLFNILPTILEILFVSGILWYLFDWRFAAVTLVTILLYVFLTFVITEWRIKLRRRMNDADNDANTKSIDSLLNFETVKYFGNERHETRRFDTALQSYEKAAVDSRVSLSALNSGQAIVISIGVVAIMVMAAMGVVAGVMTLGDFVMVNAYLIQLAMPLNLLGTVYREIKQSLIDMEVMFNLLHTGAEILDRPDAKPLLPEGGEVVFRNVSFGYDARRPILRGVDFTVPAGKTVAIVGPSGAGKSTISRLLFRFYDVTEGQILIDGQDLRAVTQDSLRASIGIVPQDTVLFNDTVYYNIAYGRPSATREEVEAAAKLARIHEFVRGLPDGYDSIVGERGLKLSGGEKQRVAIARTILKGPAILLFDEATSALDTRTERAIQNSLNEVSRDRTTLVIAHRLSTVVDADEIIVLEAGRIVERGQHENLLDREGHYATMWRRQQESAQQRRRTDAEPPLPASPQLPLDVP